MNNIYRQLIEAEIESRLVLRKFEDGQVIALYLDEPYNDNTNTVMSYMIVGEHGEASLDLIEELETCSASEELEFLRALAGRYDILPPFVCTPNNTEIKAG